MASLISHLIPTLRPESEGAGFVHPTISDCAVRVWLDIRSVISVDSGVDITSTPELCMDCGD